MSTQQQTKRLTIQVLLTTLRTHKRLRFCLLKRRSMKTLRRSRLKKDDVRAKRRNLTNHYQFNQIY